MHGSSRIDPASGSSSGGDPGGTGTAGDLIEVRGNKPLVLDDPRGVWIVEDGSVEVFSVKRSPDGGTGPRRHVFSANPGAALFGFDAAADTGFSLLAVGVGSSFLRRVTPDPGSAGQHIPRDEFLRLAEDYAESLARAVSSRLPPHFDALLSAEDEGPWTVPEGHTVSVGKGTVWILHRSGRSLFASTPGAELAADAPPFPLARGGWIAAETPLELVPAGRPGVEEIWAGVHCLQARFRDFREHAEAARALEESRSILTRIEADSSTKGGALLRLAQVMEEGRQVSLEGEDPLLAACEAIGAAMGVTMQRPVAGLGERGLTANVDAISRASSVGYRRVRLEPGWWEKEHGPLLAFRKPRTREERPSDAPLAVLPEGYGSFEILEPGTSIRTRVDEETAASLEPFAFAFYRPLPETRLTLGDLGKFILRDLGLDLRRVFFDSLAASGLLLLPPIATGLLFDWIIPGANRGQLLSLFLILLATGIGAGLFSLARSFALLRIQQRVTPALQMAVLHRLIRLPLPFFRRYSAGDLGVRASAINGIAQILGGATITSIMGSLASASTVILLFFYSWKLAILAVLLMLLVAGFSGAAGYWSLRYRRELERVDGRIAGLVLQLLSGIPKLRVSMSESRAFAKWAGEFGHQRRLRFQVGRWENLVEVFTSTLLLLSTLVLFAAYWRMDQSPVASLSTGSFLAFFAAYGTFMGSGLEIAVTLVGLLDVVPLLERARPILETLPEVDATKPPPRELVGRLEAKHLEFRYGPDTPRILKDVSFEARPGEFVAVVGPSGAGKSTLLRVLLGFERPESGSVYFDGHDLSLIDVTAVRRQIGVVLQSSQLTAGDIFGNIVGDASGTMEEAWEAARMAGLDQDVKEMPMGMQTIVSEGGANLSGGQRQRILIARALVKKPRIIFFDEATSALDNRTQAIVSESLERLHATRVVIAHRLSTIRKADRIYVLADGRNVEEGSFEDLMAADGLFAELARRQMKGEPA